MVSTALLTFFLFSSKLCEGLYNNLALTPPMGWSTWGRFRCNVNCRRFPRECISEWLLREMAYRMVADGYLSAGYEYLIVDDCWLARTRDCDGRLRPDEFRFPSGIRNLSDYIHSLGLKFGIYEDYGLKTCEGYPGILPHTVRRDAETFADWGVDYVKIDGCYSDPLTLPRGVNYLGRWLLSTGQPMVYSCSWPTYQQEYGISPNYTAAALMCNLWRNYIDIQDSWHSVRQISNYFAEHQEEFAMYAGPGHWNDPDMLIIGNFGLSYEQSKVQMALWAILAAPLIMSHDLRVAHPEFRKILINPLLISINQDPMGIQGKRIYISRRRRYEVWTRPVLPTWGCLCSWAIAIVNLDDAGEPSSIEFPMRYTKIWRHLQYYTFVDLYDVDDNVEFTPRGALRTRIPPLGLFCLDETVGLDNGLAKTPPMGWMSWQRFRCITDCKKYPDECISEKLMRETADRMAEDGYLSAGYEYLIIDDCWLAEKRDSNGRLKPDPERFPSGMKNLSDYVHSKGLKFGIYQDYGTKTCAGYPGLIGHLKEDAELFASWDVDYAKIDGCYADPSEMDEGYVEFGRHLLATERPIVYSCSWPVYQSESGITPNYTLIAEHCNLWRNYGDIQDSWSSVTSIIDYYGSHQSEFSKNAGPGHWNDPDMLIIGNYGLSYHQSKAQMAIWAILAAPLLMSHDLRDVRPEFRDILLNKDAIAINQDKLGVQGELKYKSSNIEIWVKPIEPIVKGHNSWAVAVLSKRTDGAPRSVSVLLKRIGLDHNKSYKFKEVFDSVKPFDVLAGEKLQVRIPPTSAFLFKVTQKFGKEPAGSEKTT